MKRCPRLLLRGFTLIELIVVVAIMAIMLGLAANMLKDSGRGQGLSDAEQIVYDTVREARLEAIGKVTWSRLVVVTDPQDTSASSKNLRYIAIMVKKPVKTANNTDPDSGEWELIQGGRYLPKGFYISAKYSTIVDSPMLADDVGMKDTSTFAQLIDKMRMGNKNTPLVDVFFIEFDPQGRMTEPARPTRLVVIGGMIDSNSGGDDAGIRPNPIDKDGLPALAGGIVIWPKGNISRLKTREQIFGQIK